jgi:hypothetical protein
LRTAGVDRSGAGEAGDVLLLCMGLFCKKQFREVFQEHRDEHDRQCVRQGYDEGLDSDDAYDNAVKKLADTLACSYCLVNDPVGEQSSRFVVRMCVRKIGPSVTRGRFAFA